MKLIRRELHITGTVQGVGFRPFVYRLAGELGLAGWVRNTAAGVIVEVEGEAQQVGEFARRVREEAPPLAKIALVGARELAPAGLEGFRIIESEGARRPTALIPPDVALCADCGREIGEAGDRRFGYPFTNCTNCGPRFSIVTGIPYDRAQTTMAAFEMCGECAREYRDPADRRFHAEPIACPVCGPKVRLEGGRGDARGGEEAAGVRMPSRQQRAGPSTSLRVNSDQRALQEAALLLAHGKVVAIKGLGGYHLACDARNSEAVETLRQRKGRGQKPFAVMVRDLAEARRVAEVSARAEALLTSPESPVVIMPARSGSGLVEGIAPRQHTVGVMLPYTPLHRLLMAESPAALVMTSGNLAEEPIVHTDEEARTKLGPIADFILTHNREIAVPCDDSVVRVEGELVIPVRRARGYVPRAVRIERPVNVGTPVPQNGDGRRAGREQRALQGALLAVGGHHRNTFCLLRDGEAILSQHIGDLDTLEVLDYFGRAVRHFERLFGVKAEIVAHDLHPGYLSTQWAKSLKGVRLVGVQHHHAHVVSVMAELGLEGPVIGVAYDGTGYGPDGTAWGGEILVADRREYRRAYHLWQAPLPGGEAAIARPGRMALSWLMVAFGPEVGLEKARGLLRGVTESELRVVARQIERGINSPVTSSMGRLFDAVGAMLGATAEATYEGQAAMELEAMCGRAEGRPYEYYLAEGVVDCRPVIREVVADFEQGVEREVIAARFHETVAAFTVEVCRRIREEGGPGEVVLSGGVMQNARLVGRLLELLEEAGLRGHVHREIPPHDGGMSLGQAVIAAAQS